LDNQKKEIEKREKQLTERDSEIHLRQQKIESYSQVLNSQKTEIETRQATIEKQSATLNKQNKILNSQIERIRTQAKFLYLLVALMFMASALIFVIYRNFVINKKRNQAILDKNEEIQRQSEELFEQTEQLLILNKELELKKNVLEDALNKLKNTQTKLVESEKMIILGQLTAGIAHEINNPINFINSGIEGVKIAFEQLLVLLNKYEEITVDNVDDKLKAISAYKHEMDYSNLLMDINQLTHDIKSGIFRTVEIIKGLRTFSRLDESDLKFINLHKNIDSTLIILRNKFNTKLKIVKDYGDIPQIECYPGKINQVLLNLLMNAVQAIKGAGQILIKTKLIQKEDQPFVEILVKDSGTGMTDDVKKRIFEPFFTTKDAGEGTGLGLSITQNIIEIHHGSIAVDSMQGQGSAFTILLPVIFDKQNIVTTYTELK
jgi:signal transduction histidine kinase